MTDLAFAGVSRLAELVRSGEVTSRELVEGCIERIERIDPRLNAFRTVMGERALAEADQADARQRSGDERPLLGVPLAVKDNMHVAGEVTANGSRAHGGPQREDAEIIRRLRAAGAVILGKTHLPELAIIGATESATYGMTRNPWDLERTPGGSSGGSAAAVAAGLVPAATASDGAGSIRIPASCCGIFGLKPTRGLVSLLPDKDHWFGLSVFGFHSRSVADSALLLDATADRAPERPFAETTAQAPRKLRIAYSVKPSIPAPVDAEVRRGIDETVALLRSLGHEVREQHPAWGDIGVNAIPRYVGGVADEVRRVPHPERLERRTKGYARLGRPLLPLMGRVLRDEARHVERLGRVLEDNDVLITPVAARPPVPIGTWSGLGAARTLLGLALTYPYTVPWNATGHPAASVPAGFTQDGLPVAAQLVGRHGDDATLLALAQQLQSERPWADRRPPVS